MQEILLDEICASRAAGADPQS